jgi:hypothetical protein
MPKSETLRKAKEEQNDEFYTLYEDIEKEMNSYLDFNPNVFKNKTILCPCDDPEWSNFTKYFALNFHKLGLKKLISTSYAKNSKREKILFQKSLFEFNDEKFDNAKTDVCGKVFFLTKDKNKSGRIDLDDLEWEYLSGDGDFRSQEISEIMKEVDFVITNPPFSLFREFVSWVVDANKKFLLIGNINCIAYKEIFPLLMTNRAWLGTGIGRWISGFMVPQGYELYGTEARTSKDGKRIVSTNSCLWLTNIDHGKRHLPLSLMTMADNLKFSKHKEIQENGYKKYDNYDAIDIPFSDAIPSDYEGIMGVPLTFMDKYCPEQFEIIGPAMGWTQSNMSEKWKKSVGYKESVKSNAGTKGYGIVEGIQRYHRILIKKVGGNYESKKP